MIIRNLARLHLEPCIQANKPTIVMSLTSIYGSNPLKYAFSEEPNNKNDDNNRLGRKKHNRPQIFKTTQSILKKALKNSSANTHFYRKLLLFRHVLKFKKNFAEIAQQNKFANAFFNQGFPNYHYIAFAIMALVSLTLYKKRGKNETSLKQAPSMKLDLAQSEQVGIQKLEQILAKIRKINITSTSIFIEGNIKPQEHKTDKENTGMREKRKVVSYKIEMRDKDGNVYVAEPYQGDPNNFLKYVELVQQKYQVTERADVFFRNEEVKYTYYNAMADIFSYFSPLINIAIIIWIFRKTDPSSMLKNLGKAKQFKIQAMKDIKTRFSDVAGMEQAKKQITQFVDFLKLNEKYKQMGAKIPKGALLTGPPGTGKTMLARACAGEAGVSFFYISGSEFVEVFVGLGASKVRDLFAKARQNAPAIIFIDEIDAVGKKRENSRNQQKDTTLNQLLVEMDGFTSNETIIVLAATNRKQILDNALTRPGRFDRIVEINLPDVKAREEIFMVHLGPLKIDPNVEIRTIAKRLSELTPGFSGADIANLCNEAAIIATRRDRDFITDKDFEEATERITAGYVKKNLMKQKIKKRVSIHESGHAVVSWFLKGGDPLVKLTIIPRSKGALGYAQYLPKTTSIMARNQMIDKVAIMLGGITSEEVFFGQISSGGSDDLQKVYSLTRRMVTQFGMGQETYNMTIDQQSYIQKQSSFLTDKMEEEVNNILQEARTRCRSIVEEKKNLIQALADELVLKETLNGDEIVKILGQRPQFEGTTQSKKAQFIV